jgi:hypothetical protein
LNHTDDLKPFVILSVCRQDLVRAGLSPEVVSSFSDDDMERLAEELYHRYDLNGFQEDVVFVARLMLAERRET